MSGNIVLPPLPPLCRITCRALTQGLLPSTSCALAHENIYIRPETHKFLLCNNTVKFNTSNHHHQQSTSLALFIQEDHYWIKHPQHLINQIADTEAITMQKAAQNAKNKAMEGNTWQKLRTPKSLEDAPLSLPVRSSSNSSATVTTMMVKSPRTARCFTSTISSQTLATSLQHSSSGERRTAVRMRSCR